MFRKYVFLKEHFFIDNPNTPPLIFFVIHLITIFNLDCSYHHYLTTPQTKVTKIVCTFYNTLLEGAMSLKKKSNV